MPNLKNGRPAPIFVGGSVLWEIDYSQKPDPKSKLNQWKLIMLHMRPNMPEHCSCRSSEVGNWEVSLVLKSWMFYACVLFAPVGLDWGVMYGYVIGITYDTIPSTSLNSSLIQLLESLTMLAMLWTLSFTTPFQPPTLLTLPTVILKVFR